ncbi:hypothetical protein QBC42DRAFT_286540 [Cladorrhinum samala]|uniref:Uncharacterized protein n=1 Tax=Cladorrhinum samala TaxID=585594 RepID=A0AAV9HQI8_9PEZI|nr:hypothetical protein QBC42DRAFT_286540 [Cladorrhinum samala]
MSCANYHAWFVFDKGEGWAREFSDVPIDLIRYLSRTTKIPAPKAFGCGAASDPLNKVGLSYLLIEALST